MNWDKYPNFKKEEFDCKHTGKNFMQPDFMDALQALRTEYGRPMRVTSGYRDITHPAEAGKSRPGQHNKGLAVDIACDANGAYEIMALAVKHGFTGIGVSQKAGIPRFLHLDRRVLGPGEKPVLYSY